VVGGGEGADREDGSGTTEGADGLVVEAMEGGVLEDEGQGRETTTKRHQNTGEMDGGRRRSTCVVAVAAAVVALSVVMMMMMMMMVVIVTNVNKGL